MRSISISHPVSLLLLCVYVCVCVSCIKCIIFQSFASIGCVDLVNSISIIWVSNTENLFYYLSIGPSSSQNVLVCTQSCTSHPTVQHGAASGLKFLSTRKHWSTPAPSTVLCWDQDKQVRSQRSVQQFTVIIMLKLTRRLLDSELLLAASRSLATSAPVLKPAQTQAAGESEAEPRPAPAQADTMTELGTRDIFTPDHDMFRSVVRSVLAVW